jgi:hypothetical protein
VTGNEEERGKNEEERERRVTEMTTEQHAFGSVHEVATRVALTSPPVCGCGQDLDVCQGTHCPRCGAHLLPAAA